MRPPGHAEGTARPLSEDDREIFGHRIPRALRVLAEEYRDLRQSVALLEAPWEELLEVGGAERSEFLQALLTQDLRGLTVGRTLPSSLADRRGHWLADLWAHHAEDTHRLRVRRDRMPVVLEVFEHHRLSALVTWSQPLTSHTAMLLLGLSLPGS